MNMHADRNSVLLPEIAALFRREREFPSREQEKNIRYSEKSQLVRVGDEFTETLSNGEISFAVAAFTSSGNVAVRLISTKGDLTPLQRQHYGVDAPDGLRVWCGDSVASRIAEKERVAAA